MGNQTSNSTNSPIVYCDSVCQRNKKLRNLWDDYQSKLQKHKDTENRAQVAKYNYYLMRDGPEWIKNYQKDKFNNKLQKIRVEKEKIINNLTQTYNDKIQLIYTQNNLINKQNNLINRNNKNSEIQLNEIGEMTEMITTKDREVYFKELGYKLKNEKIKRLCFILVLLLFFMIIIIVLYLLKKHNFPINLDFIKSIFEKILEWLKKIINFIKNLLPFNKKNKNIPPSINDKNSKDFLTDMLKISKNILPYEKNVAISKNIINNNHKDFITDMIDMSKNITTK